MYIEKLYNLRVVKFSIIVYTLGTNLTTRADLYTGPRIVEMDIILNMDIMQMAMFTPRIFPVDGLLYSY